MKQLKLVIFLILIILAFFYSPFGESLKTFITLETIAAIDNIMTPINSKILGEKEIIKSTIINAKQKELGKTSSVNLNNLSLNEWISRSNTQALIIWKDGKMLHESYSENTNDGSNINGLSMAKTIVALLIGIAIDEGRIESEEESILNYLPEIQLEKDENITIRTLLQQESGMRDSPLDILTTLKGESLEGNLASIKFGEDKKFKYSNVNYHLLSLILKRVYNKSLNQIISDKLWQPMQLTNAKIISSTGYCCIFASARSWLEFGKLFLNEGKLNKGMSNETQIISKMWLDKMRNDKVEPESFVVQLTSKAKGNTYAYHIFGGLESKPNMYWSEGMGLQLILIDPDFKIIVIRLGDIPSAFRSYSNRWDDNLVSELLNIINTL
jgi:CubicO group peptidase (beta-lactamase class C family)